MVQVRLVGVERFTSQKIGFQQLVRGQTLHVEKDIADYLLNLTYYDALNNEHVMFQEEAGAETEDTPKMVGKTQRRSRTKQE